MNWTQTFPAPSNLFTGAEELLNKCENPFGTRATYNTDFLQNDFENVFEVVLKIFKPSSYGEKVGSAPVFTSLKIFTFLPLPGV